ncbi:rolling circle replication-associated protein [Macrococcus armenti]|uniref:rolling circle replication-associated protein n=1 Tax=Macrococcus armenti TaxID=2875764 RepID=UPI001CC9C628|nr:hypothetical protein [Macrococcus armenti]UBH14308.1 hypothetical protein LAU43_11625 [Macrococcus armenti]
MSKKIKFVEDDFENLVELQKIIFSPLVVYLTYDQLNTHFSPHYSYYNYKVKAYDNGVLRVIRYKKSRQKSNTNLTLKNNAISSKILTEKEKKIVEEENRKRHIFEVKTKIKDYILNNHFDLFWTLTFDPKKCVEAVEDEYRYDEMRKWLNKMRTKHNRKSNKQFTYIAIPERHKSGQIHWHMVTGGLEPGLIDSGKSFRNQKIYNCLDWPHGFTNIQKMRSKSKVSSYVTKYITKDLLYSPVRKNKRKYWSSKNLILPDVYGVTDDSLMDFLTDEYDRPIKPNYSTDICDIWTIRTGK